MMMTALMFGLGQIIEFLCYNYVYEELSLPSYFNGRFVRHTTKQDVFKSQIIG